VTNGARTRPLAGAGEFFEWIDLRYSVAIPDFPRDTGAWIHNVRNPAEKAAEGKRTLTAGGASASYRIAQLPDGQWAICIQTKLEFVSGMTIPWRVLPTREEAVAYFIVEAKAFFERETRLKTGKAEHRKKILELLNGDGGLFGGFIEPDPDPPSAG
jgi:hypothetical protein